VAIPARNESANLPACLRALAKAARGLGEGEINVVVLANNCDDGTADSARNAGFGRGVRVTVLERRLPPHLAHAGFARRLALDAAADLLRDPNDLLLSTDADTWVAEDWFARTTPYFDQGFDAVAGLARLMPRQLRVLPADLRRRFAILRRYEQAITYLRASRDTVEPWPRHFYEGGASMALTLGAYRAVGGAPTPRVGEDKALFEAVRTIGGRVRHPLDVRVLTSARLVGRAQGGTSDTLSAWGQLEETEIIDGVTTIEDSLDLKASGFRRLTFATLPAELERARQLAATPDVQPIGFMARLDERFEPGAHQIAQGGDRIVG
jgi:hypothetical protein